MPSVPSTRVSTVQAATPKRGKRGLTCTNCRIRKARCDGNQPGCKTCEIHRDECHYEQMPPMSQIRDMVYRLQEAEKTIAALQSRLEGQKEDIQKEDIQKGEDDLRAIFGGMDDLAEASTALNAAQQGPAEPSEDPEKALMSDISLDERGKLSFHGPTSAVHDPPSASPSSSVETRVASQLDMKAMLKTNALELRDWEEFALNSAAAPSDIPRNTISKLLQVYWTWLAPMFMWTYRYPFIRDMTTGGQYFSQFLLTVMCAHAARFYNTNIADLLIVRVRQLLGAEILKPSAIPTVQGLLMLSARDLAYGQISQAWLYSGMAFRMVSDLGLHHNTSKIASLGTFKPEDLEIRKRLFWSCYLWDKAISLYLGRMPILTAEPSEDGPDLLDDVEEDEFWVPYNVDGVTFSHVAASEYPQYKTSANSCFQNNCKLAVILNDILLQLYSRKAGASRDTALPDISNRLEAWRRNSPEHLVYQTPNLPKVCPPPHIVSQNLLYHTAVILLHRPFWSSPAHRNKCRQAADEIEALLLLLESTFAFNRIHYLMAYCLYTGASVMLQDLKNGDQSAMPKVETFLRALRGAVLSCPVVQRSVDIITNSLNQGRSSNPAQRTDPPHPVFDWNARNPCTIPPFESAASPRSMWSDTRSTTSRTVNVHNQPDPTLSDTNDPFANLFNFGDIPAFPHRDPIFDSHIDATQGMGGIDPLSFLMSFPETQNSGLESGWPPQQ